MDRPPTHARTRRFNPQWIVGAVVLVLAAFTVLQGVVFSQRAERMTECQRAFSNQVADALQQRSAGSQQAQRAMDQLVTSIGERLRNPPMDEPGVQRAIDTYLSQRAEVSQRQRANPYPPPPRDACPLPG